MALLKKVLVFSICFLVSELADAQLQRPFNRDVKFVEYLQGRELHKEALIALNEIPLQYLNPSQIDTFNFLKGWGFYNLKSLDSSASYLLRVSKMSPYFMKSRFFGAYNLIYLKKYNEAVIVLGAIPDSPSVKEIKHFEKAGISLLKNNFAGFDSISAKFSYNSYALTAQEKNFQTYKNQLIDFKKKSPVVAGLMSAVIPGSGKIYAGKTYQGIASMLPIAALALLTNESYHKRGPRSAEFYIFGSLLTVFYVGNIWGSVFSVKITREEHEKLIHQKVLLDLQIPLRTIFN